MTLGTGRPSTGATSTFDGLEVAVQHAALVGVADRLADVEEERQPRVDVEAVRRRSRS